MNRCFIHCHVPTQKSFLLRVNSFKQRSESWIHCCFCSTVSKRGTHLEYNFFILQFSYTTLNTVPFDIFRMSAISCNFTFRSDKMIFRIFCVFPGVATSVGRPGRSTSAVFVRPRLKSAYHRQMVVFDGEFSRQHFSSYCWAWPVFLPIKKQCLINTWNSFSFIVYRITKVASLNLQYHDNDWAKCHTIFTRIFWRLVLPKTKVVFRLWSLKIPRRWTYEWKNRSCVLIQPIVLLVQRNILDE